MAVNHLCSAALPCAARSRVLRAVVGTCRGSFFITSCCGTLTWQPNTLQAGAVGSKRKLTPAGAVTGNTTPQGLPAGQPPGRARPPPKPGRKGSAPQHDPWLR